MFGNTGEKWVQIKELSINHLTLNEVGTEFKIGEYYSVPHGYTSIKYENCLLFIPDNIFEEHFVKLDIYKLYHQLGDKIMINANGNLGSYTIENVDGTGHYVTLSLKRD